MWEKSKLGFFFCYSCQVIKKTCGIEEFEALLFYWLLALIVNLSQWKNKKSKLGWPSKFVKWSLLEEMLWKLVWSESYFFCYKMLISKCFCFPFLTSVKTIPLWGGSVQRVHSQKCDSYKSCWSSVLTSSAPRRTRSLCTFLRTPFFSHVIWSSAAFCPLSPGPVSLLFFSCF